MIVGVAGAFRPSTVLLEPMRQLSERFDILLADMPGFNGSGPAESPCIDLFARHVCDLVAAELGGRKLMLLGESFGGVVVLAVAALLGPERIAGIAMVDPPLSQAAQAKARAYLRELVAGQTPDPFLAEYLDGNMIIRDADPDGYLGRVREIQAWAPMLVLAGGRTDNNTTGAPATLNSAADEAAIRASDPPDLAFLRFAEAGHQVLREAPRASIGALRQFYDACADESVPSLREAAGAFARSPADAGLRERLLQVLRQCAAQSRLAERDCLLPLIRARPDDAELFNEILRVLYAILDAEGMAAVRSVAAQASDPNAVLWARLHIANTLSGMGDIDGAIAEIRSFHFGGPLPARVATLLVNLELYATGADDWQAARAKDAGLRNTRAFVQAVPSVVPAARGSRPRAGFVSGCIASRNYSSLLVPFLAALAESDFDVELLSRTDFSNSTHGSGSSGG